MKITGENRNTKAEIRTVFVIVLYTYEQKYEHDGLTHLGMLCIIDEMKEYQKMHRDLERPRKILHLLPIKHPHKEKQKKTVKNDLH